MDRKETTPDTSPVALEDLLKLKRLEQPDAAFWSSFEHDFKKRILKELVKKPSLKEAFAHWLSTSGSRWVPASAVAAAAFFFANEALITTQESTAPVSFAAPATQSAAPEVAQMYIAPAAPADQYIASDSVADETVWSDAETDFTVDFIVASAPAASEERSFSTDFTPDTLDVGYAAPASYAEKVYTSNIATLYPDAFRLGM